MSGIVNLLWFVLILGAIVIVHEFGHLLAAKKFGVYCKEFSIGTVSYTHLTLPTTERV